MTNLGQNTVTAGDRHESRQNVTLNVNGQEHQLAIDPRLPCSIAFAKCCISPAPRWDAITANAAPAPFTSTAAVTIVVWRSLLRMTAMRL
jgi:hypothetical protein